MLLSILLGVQMNDSDIEGFQDDDGSESNFEEPVAANAFNPAANTALENAANTESPAVLKIFPPCCKNRSSNIFLHALKFFKV